MHDERARELLAAERERIERELEGRRPAQLDELSRSNDADLGSELFVEELDEGIADRLRSELEAVERAEQRLAQGTYGRSIESGEAIPDERLEAQPAAERTAAEQARLEGQPAG